MRGKDFMHHGLREVLLLPDQSRRAFIFCFETLAIAETAYREIFNKDLDITAIIDELGQGNRGALQIVAFSGAVVADRNLLFPEFMEKVFFQVANTKIIRNMVIENINKMFALDSEIVDGEEPLSEFPWDMFYKAALSIGMSGGEFWGSTPRKIWLLTRDKEKSERQEWLTKTYV